MLFHFVFWLGLISSPAEARAVRQIHAFAFELDGSLARLPDVATDALDQNQFLSALRLAISDPKYAAWKQKQWDRFVKALNDPETQPFVSIIASRGHSPEHVMEGLEYLKEIGQLKNLPRLSQIHTIGYQRGRYRRLENSAAKTAVIEEQLDWIADHKLIGRRHYFEFSDDSAAYIEPIKEHIRREKEIGRWRNVDVVITQTLGDSEISWRVTDEIRLLEGSKDQQFGLLGCLKELVGI